MKDSTVQDLDALYKKARQARARFEPAWFMCLAYYEGHQWLAWTNGSLYRPVLSANQIRITDNRIMPCVETQVAKMTKNRPVFTVTPNTPDEEDANAADLGERVMRYLWKHLNLQEVYTKALRWSRITGAGFAKHFWDPTMGVGSDVVVGPSGKPLTDSQGRVLRPNNMDPNMLAQQMGLPPGSVQKRRVSQGDIRVEARSPFQIFPDPMADSFPELEWLIEESVLSQERVLRQWGVEVPTDTAANPGLVQARLGMGSQSTYRGVKVWEYWSKPSVAHPNGRRAVWAKDRMLFEDDNPFDPMPYVMFSGTPVPGRLWPTSVADQLRGPQVELNKLESQIAENCNRIGNPTILFSKQAVQDPDKFMSTISLPGGAYGYDDVGSPNAVPTYLQAPPLPQYVIERYQQIEESIQEISGQHEVSSASVPPGVTAASAINLLLETDDTRLGPGVTDWEVNLERAGQKILKLVAKNYTDARTIPIAGDNGVWEIQDFRGSMLRDNTHVEVQAGSAFPQSKAAKQAAMQDLLTFFVQSGNPPHGKQLAQFLKDWEIGGADRLINEYTLDESQVDRENVLMHQCVPININEYDNDQAHIDGHQDEQKGAGYQQWPNEAKMIMEAHVAMHKQRLAGQQQAQMQLQQQMEGGGQQQGPPDPTQAAQGVSDLQGQQLQQQIQAAQAQHQISSQSAQQGQQMAQNAESSAQSQRQAEEAHQQQMRHREEQHQARLAQMRNQQKGQQR